MDFIFQAIKLTSAQGLAKKNVEGRSLAKNSIDTIFVK